MFTTLHFLLQNAAVGTLFCGSDGIESVSSEMHLCRKRLESRHVRQCPSGLNKVVVVFEMLNY